MTDYTVLAAASDGRGTVLGHHFARASLLLSFFQADLALKNLLMRSREYIPGVRYTVDGQRYHQANRRPREITEALNSFRERVERAATRGPIPDVDPRAVAALEDTVRRALSELPGVRMMVITEPVHSSAYAANEFRGLYDVMTSTALALSRAVERASDGKAEFWDCSLFNAMTEEPVPPPSTAQPMMFWHDSSHPTAVFGNRILGQLAARNGTSGPCAPVNSRTEKAYEARRAADKVPGLARGAVLARAVMARW